MRGDAQDDVGMLEAMPKGMQLEVMPKGIWDVGILDVMPKGM